MADFFEVSNMVQSQYLSPSFPEDYNGSDSERSNLQRSETNYSRNYSLLQVYDNDRASGSDINNREGENETEERETEEHDANDQTLSSGGSEAQTTVGAIDDKRSSVDSFVKPLNGVTSEELMKSAFDRYGFKKASSLHNIAREQYNAWFQDYSQYSLRRKKKWQVLMKNSGLPLSSDDEIPTRFPPKSDKVKRMIRRGIPAEWRGNAWFFYAGGYDKLNKHKGVYAQVVRDTIGLKNKDTEIIERDLRRTFPDNIHFNEALSGEARSEAGDLTVIEPDGEEATLIGSLRRVLTAFAYYQPQIGYCQSLNFLAGLLLLFMDEERSFWLLVILTERIIPKVHSKNLEGVHTDQGVLMLCVKEYIPSLWSTLGKNFEGETLSDDKILTRLPPVTLVTSSWFMSVFIGILPIESTLRIWDILWYEGSKTLFRISLTVFRMCLDSPEFQKARDNSGGTEMEQIELFQFMQSFPKAIFNPNILVENCFKKIGGYGYGSLSQEEINKCREFVSKQRAKMNRKHSALVADMTDEERKLLTSSPLSNDLSDEIHDVYGFHRSIMSGISWNKNISNSMKRRFVRRK